MTSLTGSRKTSPIIRRLCSTRYCNRTIKSVGPWKRLWPLTKVLLDREAGQSQEPLVARQPEPPPPPYTDPANLAYLFGVMALGAAAGFVVIPTMRVRQDDDPSNADQPVPFGPRMAWLALDTTDTEAVGAALGLRGMRAATWTGVMKCTARPSSSRRRWRTGHWL